MCVYAAVQWTYPERDSPFYPLSLCLSVCKITESVSQRRNRFCIICCCGPLWLTMLHISLSLSFFPLQAKLIYGLGRRPVALALQTELYPAETATRARVVSGAAASAKTTPCAVHNADWKVIAQIVSVSTLFCVQLFKVIKSPAQLSLGNKCGIRKLLDFNFCTSLSDHRHCIVS